MHNFKELKAWNNSMDLAASIYKVTEFFPQEERFGITSQMRRASVSIPSLIAEGAGRNTNKDFANFIGMAIGSCYELETQLILSSRLNFIKENTFKTVLEDCLHVAKMLVNFKKTLNT